MSIYSKEKTSNLRDCLSSLLRQTLLANEVILVHDGPISNQLNDIIEDFRSDLKIISIYNKENIGLAASLNKGLKFCSNELIVRVDTDDICLPDRFKKQIDFMVRNPEIVASSGAIEIFQEKGEKSLVKLLPLNHDMIVRYAKTRNPLYHSASIFRKSIIERVGGYPLFNNSQDYALWTLLILKGYKLANIDELLIKFRAGDDFLKRRGFSYLKNELKLIDFQREIGFLNNFEFLFNILFRSVLRLVPKFFIRNLYKLDAKRAQFKSNN